MSFRWSGANILAVALLAGAALLTFLSLFTGMIIATEPWVEMFAITAEQNIPTFYSVFLILIAGIISLAVGLLIRPYDGRMAVRWYVLAGLLLLLALDEAASLHERLEPVGRAVFGGGAGLHFAWVIPGIVLAVLVLSAVYLIARSLPRPIAVELLAGMGLFLFAAVGLEIVGGLILSSHGHNMAYIAVSTGEEFLEMVGTVLIVHAASRMVSLRRRADGAVVLSYAGGSLVPQDPGGAHVRRAEAVADVDELDDAAAPDGPSTRRCA